MESHDAEFANSTGTPWERLGVDTGRPTLKPAPAKEVPREMRIGDAYGYAKAWEAEQHAKEQRIEDVEVRCYALLAACTLFSDKSHIADETHVLSQARRFEEYIRNG